jgi:hypothetical protein
MALAAGAYPIWRLARLAGISQRAALATALAYLLYPMVLTSNLFDFHPETISVAAILFAVLAARERRVMPFVIALIITLGAKEVMGPGRRGDGLLADYVRASPSPRRHCDADGLWLVRLRHAMAHPALRPGQAGVGCDVLQLPGLQHRRDRDQPPVAPDAMDPDCLRCPRREIPGHPAGSGRLGIAPADTWRRCWRRCRCYA